MSTDEYREAFNLFDKDSDGQLDINEVGTVMRALGQNPTQAELNQIKANFQAKGKTQIDFSDFLPLMASPRDASNMKRDVEAAFKVFDKENLGYINVNQLVHILTSVGEKLTKDEVNDMIKAADRNNDGKITMQNFVDVLVPK
ncbi:calmodulin [Polychytrium aggregatum]|uniref:calmodulin n=1 Tax=Polychytrium aggregatum TaxID=110093 RepID=UPI0022FF242F|nr:calmodulin [Polychytrium aggregatum]KAI9209433.1 calmodulin [Polychytrium aggregatum]